MNLELTIARRFIKSSGKGGSFTSPIIRLSVVAIALSMAIMIIAVATVTGFKNEIRNRVTGFGGHIQIVNFDSNNSLESSPIDKNQSFLPELIAMPGIKNIQVFATKPAMIKTKNEIQGIIMKGIGPDFDTLFFAQNIVEGGMPKITDSAKTNQVLISKKLANMLHLKLGEKFTTFFIDERISDVPINRRVFQICGIYQTSLETFDEQFILGDIKHIQTLNGWNNNQVGGFEILISNYGTLDYLTENVRLPVEFRFMEDGSRLRVLSIKEKYPQIFDWLNLLDMNVVAILVIMIIVAIINMISGLIILILDRTPSIGLLKALGTSNPSMRKIFLYQAAYLILKGLLWGNILAIGLLLLQHNFHLIKLNQASYFIEYAPVNINMWHIAVINIAALSIIFVFMLLPVIILSRIQPVKTLRYS
ncbi:MAG: ABC transporter permease [Bacteroidales bacterium]|nr:ABC transporter permease [Bacteroidales bacterium]